MELLPNPIYVLAQMVPFVLLIFVLRSLVFNPMLAYLAERRRRMTGFSHDARAMEEETDRRLQELEQALVAAKGEIAEVRSQILQEAVTAERQLVAEARERAEAQVNDFRAELAESQKLAGVTLRQEVEALSKEMAGRVLGRVLA